MDVIIYGMLGLKLSHVSETDPWSCMVTNYPYKSPSLWILHMTNDFTVGTL